MIASRTGVVIAGALVNFCLGIFYAWSVFADGLIKELGWTKSMATLPYTIELLAYAVAMVLGGRFQDRYGPRKAVMLSGLLAGSSFLVSYFTASPVGVAVGFGVIFGSASAFGYSAVTPAVIRWFPPEKKGLVTGIVLMSLASAALVWSPLVNLLIIKYGVINTFLICGIALLLIILPASRVIRVPEGEKEFLQQAALKAGLAGDEWRVTLRRPEFRIIWLMVGLTSGVGIMFVGQLVQIAELNYQIAWGYLLVSLFAGANAIGRMVGGLVCDRFGYMRNLKAGLMLMTGSMLFFLSGGGHLTLVAASVLLGLSYGSLFTSFPLIVAEIFGLKNFGLNYGLIFTSLGLVGGLGPLVAAALAQITNSYFPAFILGLAASLFCFYLVALLRRETAAVKAIY